MTSAADRALADLPEGATIVAGPGCGTPLTGLRALGRVAGDGRRRSLVSGLQLGDYPFLDAVRAGNLTYATWHVFGPARETVAAGDASYLPLRASEVPAAIARLGVDACLVRVTPPDRHGYLSLGPSVSYPLSAVRGAATVIAEVDETLPRTLGASWIHRSEVTHLIDAEEPAPVYEPGQPDETSQAIAARVVEWIPLEPTLQLGIGAVPEAITHALASADLGPLRFVGLATDAMLDLFDQGAIPMDRTVPDPGIAAVEVMGSRALLDRVDLHPGVGVYPSSVGHTPQRLAESPRLVSVNSAIEVDLTGQVNAEFARGSTVAGVGGSTDFTEAATASVGGLRIIAFPSTAARGTVSRIVPELTGGVVTTPRQAAEIIITEHGVADLRARSLRERAEALAAIAAPAHRDALAETIPG